MKTLETGFHFAATLPENLSGAVLRAVVPERVEGRAGLFDTLADQLQFPDYFGTKWAALNDCLKDFHWTDARQVIIVHRKLDFGLEEPERRTYLEVLAEAVECWKTRPKLAFAVVFPPSDEKTVREMVNVSSR